MFLPRAQLDILILAVIKENERMIIDITIREIIEEVRKRTGYNPSTSIVMYALRRLGITAQQGKARSWTRR